MIYLLAALAVFALIAAVFFMLWRGSSKSLKSSREEETRLRAEIEHRDGIILTLQEAQRVQKNRTEKITSGDDASRVAGSLDVLSDVSRASKARAGSH